jgi:hypothetical protein
MSGETKRRPPKRNIAEAIAVLDAKASVCEHRAIQEQKIVDAPPRPYIDQAYHLRLMNSNKRKAERLHAVIDWLKDIIDV